MRPYGDTPAVKSVFADLAHNTLLEEQYQDFFDNDFNNFDDFHCLIPFLVF